MSPISRPVGRSRALLLALVAAGMAVPRAVRAEDARADSTSTSTSTPTQGDPPSPPAGAGGEGRGEGGRTAPPTESIEVVGERPRRTQAARDPAAAATVVEAERFAGEAKSVAELVATAPGVAIHEYGGLGHIATVSIRGSNANGVLVLVDGIPLNTEGGGGVDLSTIPRTWIDRIEIVRGPEGAAFGAGALGGAVNVVTHRAAPGPPTGEATAGSFGTYAASTEARAGSSRAALLVAATGEASEGAFPWLFDEEPAEAGTPLDPRVRGHNATARGGLLAKGRLDAGDHRLDALLQLSGGRRELPSPPYNDQAEGNQREARVLAALRIASPGPVDGLALSARAHARVDVLDLDQGGVHARQRDLGAGLEAEAVLDHAGGSARLALAAGSERIWGEGFGPGRQRASVAAAASEDLRVGVLRLLPAVRVERFGGFSGWSAKLGAEAAIVGPLRARASAGRTFRAPSIAELYLNQALVAPNADLRSETGLGADAALVAEGPAGLASVGGHVTRYDDLIIYRPSTLGLKPFNSDRALVAGLEVEGATAPLGRLRASVEAAYTWLVSETLRGDPLTVGRELPRRPPHRLFARLAIAPGPLSAHVETHHVARQLISDRGLGVIPAATVWNAGASLRILSRPDVRLAVEVKNLLDDRTILDPTANPLPGRMTLVTARVDAPTSTGRSTP